MTEARTLAIDQRVRGRPFADPEHGPRDLARMRQMARQLLESYHDPAVCDFLPGQRPVCQSDPQGRHFRIYYVRPKLLFSQKQLAVVGFFGHKRPGADIAPLVEADKRFERTFHDHPGLLSLSTVRLPEGDYANLVVFTDPDAKDHWNRMPLHADTVSQISPPYYEHIRLNNAYLPEGLVSPETMALVRVRYIDYDEEPAWRAVRQVGVYPA